MKQRCMNPKNNKYSFYGARGIKVCDRWVKSFDNFLADMGYRPSKKHSIDRINNDGDYCPENCKWATHKEQCNNRRTSVRYMYNGKEVSMSDLMEISGLNQPILWYRINKIKMSVEDAVSKPLNGSKILCFGELQTLEEISKKYNIKPETIRYRLKRVGIEDAVSREIRCGLWLKNKKAY